MSKFILKEAREDHKILLRSSWRDKKALYNYYAKNYVRESQIKGVPKSHVTCMMMVAEKHGIHPQELINEGIWGSIKNFFKKGEQAVEEKDETMDVSEEEIRAYMDSKASIFKRWEQAKKSGASTWQGFKHAFGGIGSMFQQGQQVWDITGKKGAKLQVQAKKGFDKIKKELESDFLEPIMKDLNKALKDPKLGKPQAGGFPNNPRPADFRHILYGHTSFRDLDASGEMKGIFGYMLAAKQALQTAVDNGLITADTANATVKKMVRILQFYAGALDDSKASLENRSRGRMRGNLLTSYSLELTLMGSDYYWSQMLKEGEESEASNVVDLSEFAANSDEIEGLDSLSKEDAKKLGEYFADPKNNKPPGGLSDKALKGFKASDSLLKPLIYAMMGAIYASIGISKGGNPLGDFENSYAYSKFMNSLQGVEFHRVPETIATEFTTTVEHISPKKGSGFVEGVYAMKGWQLPSQGGTIRPMSEIKAAVDDLGLRENTAELKKTIMKNLTEKDWAILDNAPDDMSAAAWANSLETYETIQKPVATIADTASAGNVDDLAQQLAELKAHLGGAEMELQFLTTQAANIPQNAVSAATGNAAISAEDMTAFLKEVGVNNVDQFMERKADIAAEIAKDESKIAYLESMVKNLSIDGKNSLVQSVEETVHTGGPSTGTHPFSMFLGDAKIIKTMGTVGVKAGSKYMVRTFAAGQITKTALGAVALPTIIATVGAALVASGVSIAVLRAAAKSRRETFKTCIEILEEPIKVSAEGQDTIENMEDVNVEPATPSEEIKVATPHEELENILQFPIKQLEKDGADKDQIKKFIDHGFDPEDMEQIRNDLNVPPKDLDLSHYSLKGILLSEDMEFDRFSAWADDAAKNAGINLSDENKENLAMSFNLADHIGDVTGLPDDTEQKQVSAELEALQKQLDQMSSEKQDLIKQLGSQDIELFLGDELISEMDKEIKELMAGKKELSDVIGDLENMVKSGKVEAETAIEAKKHLEVQLKAVQQSAAEEEVKLRAEIASIKDEAAQYLKNAQDASKDINSIAAFSEKIMGEPITEILKDPDGFIERFMNKKDKEQQKVLNDLQSKDDEIDALNKALEEAKKQQAKTNTYGAIFRYLKKLVGRAGKDKRYSFKFGKELDDFMKNKRTAYSDATGKNKETIDSVIKNIGDTVLKPMGVQISEPYDHEGYQGSEHRGKRKKKQEAAWHKGDIIIERWSQLAGLPVINEEAAQEKNQLLREAWWSEKHETLADQKYSDTLDVEEAELSQEEMDIMFDQISDEIEEMGSAVAEQSIADMWLDDNEYLYRGIYIDTRPHQGGKVKIVWPGWNDARYRGDLGW